MAVELKANPKIINIAHHHTNYNGYWTEPHASVSRDFSHVLFSSNWGTSSDTDADAFMVRLHDNLFGAVAPIADALATTVDASVTGSSGIVPLFANASHIDGVRDVEFMVHGAVPDRK